MIDKYLRRSKELDDHVVHLLFSANRWEQSQKMKSDLSSGVTLIVDRYAYSGVAFTSSKKVICCACSVCMALWCLNVGD